MIEARVDKLKAYQLRVQQKLTYEQIGKLMGVSAQAVHASLQALSKILPDPEDEAAFQSVKPQLLGAAEMKLLASLLEDDRISKASANNIAYALRQVHEMRRLETGQSTSNIATLTKLIGSSDDHLFPSKDKNSGQNTQSTDVSSENVG